MASSLPCVAAPLSSSSCFSSLPRELRGSSLSSSSVRTWTSQNLLDDVWMAIPTEAKNYELGEALYYVVLVGNTITWQFFFLGVIGVIFCASSLFSGIMIAVLLPVTEILAVICFWETFQAEKGVSLALSLWGLASYFNGEFKLAKKEKVRAAAAEAD